MQTAHSAQAAKTAAHTLTIVWSDDFARLSMEKRKGKTVLHIIALRPRPSWEEWRTLQKAVRQFYAKADAKADGENKKLCLVFDLRELGMLPIPMFQEWREMFDELRPITERIIHCSAMVLSPFIRDALLLFLQSYKSVSKIYISADVEEAIQMCVSHA